MNEEMLCRAAARSSQIHALGLEKACSAGVDHCFSPAFERKLRTLKRRADHAWLYQASRRAAVVLMFLLLGTAVWLTVDTEARAFVQSWVRSHLEDGWFHYEFQGETDGLKPVVYEPGWIPEGYTEWRRDETESGQNITYINADGQLLHFGYTWAPAGEHWFADGADAKIRTVDIGGVKADLLRPKDPEAPAGLVWMPDETAFYVSGFLSDEALIRLAEGVRYCE